VSLNSTNLSKAAAGVRRPGYDRARLAPGVVHLGIGNFHRAHQAIYLEDLVERTGLGLGIVGVSLKSPGMRDKLMPQDGLYSLLVRDGAAVNARIVGIIGRMLVGPEDPAAVVRQIADPVTRLVTLTVTRRAIAWILRPIGSIRSIRTSSPIKRCRPVPSAICWPG